MSKKTEQFNVTVKVGKKSYAPGEPVPVGTGGITAEEADNFRKNFGAFTAGSDAKAGPGSIDLEKLREALEKLSTDNDKLSADNDRLTAERDSAIGDRDALLKQNEQLETDTATLAAEIAKLQAEIEKLKAPK
jgi:outer membrane murein-binding lipoprotein Lpp